MSERQTQEQHILTHLESGQKITPLDALNLYGCLRLGGRIFDLKKRGFKIQRQMVTTAGGAHVAQYFLPKEEK